MTMTNDQPRINMRFSSSLIPLIVSFAAFADAAPRVDYASQIKPILRSHCYACHAALKQTSGLRLDTAEALRRGGDTGTAVVPGEPQESLLLQVVTGEAGFRMPPEGEGEPLDEEELALLRAWIEQGARAPSDEQPEQDPREHWSYQPVQRPSLPVVASEGWAGNPIDAFVSAKHSSLKLKSRPEADKHVLLRRVYLDLVGIPPTREQLHAFLADPSPVAFERVVDQLLASPQYGERWGRHWMDVWRYSDWYGRRPSNEIRYSQRHIWRWRDWIISSMNQDKGYDRMLVEMLAGDEVAPTDNEVLAATGFLGRNWYKFDRNAWLFETVEQTSKGLLALTMRCARCHDHKFDPITQVDYYRFRAFLEPHSFRTDRVSVSTATEVDNRKDTVLQEGLARAFDAELDPPTYVFLRGDDRRPDKERPLTPGVPEALSGAEIHIREIGLPAECAIPELRDVDAAYLMETERTKLSAAESAVKKSQARFSAVRASLANALASNQTVEAEGSFAPVDPAQPFLADDFEAPNPQAWQQLTGKWEYSEAGVIESEVRGFATMVTLQDHPENFRARIRYRTLKAGGYRSVGFSFDYLDSGNSQDVYTSISSGGKQPNVHAFHRTGGKQVYPREAIVPVDLSLNEVTVLEATVHGSRLRIAVNGQEKLDYKLPVPRRSGKFALWVHQGSAQFLGVELRSLRPTLADLRRAERDARDALAISTGRLAVARAELAAVRSRLEAERAKYADPVDPEFQDLAAAASQAERRVAIRRAEQKVIELEAKVGRMGGEKPDSVRQLGQARQAAAAARAAAAERNLKYTSFEAQHPRKSTGRRLALANWLIDPRNPRTARVAVNHIWLRHMGQPIVTPVDDFGPRSKPRTHPNLLDWLAAELVESDWSMKHVHRLIVTSRTYRTVSTPGRPGNSNLAIDPDNRYLWRMNSRRMEAEVVRDSLLAASDSLDLVIGGPDLAETTGQTSHRRSMYFRTTPDNKMLLLELFDLANPNECYRRRESVVPQQALALTNSPVALSQSRLLARRLTGELDQQDDHAPAERFVAAAFERVLSRPPNNAELAACKRFLARHERLLQSPDQLTKFPSDDEKRVPPHDRPRLRARENLVHVLFSHNDFVTIR